MLLGEPGPRPSQRLALLLERPAVALARIVLLTSLVVGVARPIVVAGVVAVVVVLLALLVLGPEVADPQPQEPTEVALARLDRELALSPRRRRRVSASSSATRRESEREREDARCGAEPR